MNSFQALWWEQAKSDLQAFLLVRGHGLAPCHALHYLQMVTEKIAKAYFWRAGHPPSRSHAGIVQFLRFLGQVRQHDRQRIANLFGYKRFADFQHWLREALPIAYDLQRMAPALAGNGENPEYPWPHLQPRFTPATYDFKVWHEIQSVRGRALMRLVEIAVNRFDEFADK
jgi:hypothetical protein